MTPLPEDTEVLTLNKGTAAKPRSLSVHPGHAACPGCHFVSSSAEKKTPLYTRSQPFPSSRKQPEGPDCCLRTHITNKSKIVGAVEEATLLKALPYHKKPEAAVSKEQESSYRKLAPN